MVNKKQKKGSSRGAARGWRLWTYLILIGVILVLFVFLRGNYGFIRYVQLYRQKQELLREINRLNKKQKLLKEEIRLLKTDYQYIEKILREKYRMGKKGEKVYVVTPKKDQGF